MCIYDAMGVSAVFVILAMCVHADGWWCGDGVFLGGLYRTRASGNGP